MILDLAQFDKLMVEPFMQLPLYWDGKNLIDTLNTKLYPLYLKKVKTIVSEDDFSEIDYICKKITEALDNYYRGFPARSYRTFNSVMKILINRPLKIYQKSGWVDAFKGDDPLRLYRIRNVKEYSKYARRDIFHPPYDHRSKISTCRYSIAGFPCLYLSTTLDLCCEEIKLDVEKGFTIASKFALNRNLLENNRRNIQVIEMAVMPKDFKDNQQMDITYQDGYIGHKARGFNEIDLNNISIKRRYLYWYPLLAACSYIRENRADPFASEYIIPQLLMQWVHEKSENGTLYGIRYFSCASRLASDLGFNYVFPVSGEKYSETEYCNVLAKSFIFSKPIYINRTELPFYENELQHCLLKKIYEIDLY